MKPRGLCPLTLEYPDGSFESLVEAAVDDYARMRVSPFPRIDDALISHLHGGVRGKAPFTTPWRAFIIGNTPGELLEHNTLVQNLGPPCAQRETEWIRPGKAIREMSLSTAGRSSDTSTGCYRFSRIGVLRESSSGLYR